MVIIPSTLTTYSDGSCIFHIKLKLLPSLGSRINMVSTMDDIDYVELRTIDRTIELEPLTADKSKYSIKLSGTECSSLSSGELVVHTTKGHFIFGYVISNGKDNRAEMPYVPEENRTPFDVC